MPKYEIEVNQTQLDSLSAQLKGIRGGMGVVVSRAINKVTAHTYSQLIWKLNKPFLALGIQPKWVRKAIGYHKASPRVWMAWLTVRYYRIPLLWFTAVGGATGAQAKVLGKGVVDRSIVGGITFRAPPGAEWALSYGHATRGRSFLPHAFIAVMKSGHKGVFLRAGKKRLPIAEQFGPSALEVYQSSKEIAQSIMADGRARLESEMDVQVRVLISQKAAESAALQSIAANIMPPPEPTGVAA